MRCWDPTTKIFLWGKGQYTMVASDFSFKVNSLHHLLVKGPRGYPKDITPELMFRKIIKTIFYQSSK
jgi:hypothetical protein